MFKFLFKLKFLGFVEAPVGVLPIKVKWNLKVQILIWADNPSGLNRVFLDREYR